VVGLLWTAYDMALTVFVAGSGPSAFVQMGPLIAGAASRADPHQRQPGFHGLAAALGSQ
jgi:hypothetical protein